jgi:hypothetical protein
VGGVATTWQRHYIQNGYADTLTRLLIRRLKQKGVWDKAMVVVTADHGIDFDPRTYRRIASPGDFGGIANSPLFIKYPGQRHGKVSELHTHTVDIVPTIAQVLGVKVPYKTLGKPVSEAGTGGRITIKNGLKSTVSEPFSKMLAERRLVLERATAWLGADTGLWQLGPRSDLLGKPAPPVSGAGSSGTASLYSADQWNNVKFGKGLKVPAFVAATLAGVNGGRLIAISVNGRVAATCRSFLFKGDTWAGAVVPPSTLHRGRNSIGVYLIGAGGSLTPLGGN